MLDIKESIIANRDNSSLLECGLARIGHYRSELMGLAIVWIMMLHGAELYPKISVPVVTAIANRGNLGVDIFLFLSGFGLWFSMEKNNDTISFYSKRIRRVLIPYLLLAIPFWSYNAVFHKYKFWKFLADLTGISFITNNVIITWYVFLILILYLLYPLIFKLERGKAWIADMAMIIFSIFFPIFIWRISPIVYHNVEIAITRVPGFLVGSLGARILCHRDRGDKVFLIICLGISMVAFLLSIIVHETSHGLSIALYRYGGIGVSVVLLFFSSHILELVKRNAILKHLGNTSLELYLIHVFIRAIMRNHRIGLGGSVASSTCIWTIAIFVSVLLSTLFNYEYASVGRKKK